MITVAINKKDENYTGFSVSGHAGYAEQGKDIVCSAISALTINCVNSLLVLAGAEILECRDITSYFGITLLHPNATSNLLMGSYMLGVEGTQLEYNQHVNLIVNEM